VLKRARRFFFGARRLGRMTKAFSSAKETIVTLKPINLGTASQSRLGWPAFDCDTMTADGDS
jgi:hypothetical protein